MLLNEIKTIKSSKKELKDFGLMVGGVLLALGGFALWRGKPVYPYLLAAGGLLFVFGLIAPSLLKPVQKAWMTLAVLMGWGMTRVLLTLLFYLAVTPLSLIARLCGNDFLGLKEVQKQKESYWIPREQRKLAPAEYEKQF